MLRRKNHTSARWTPRGSQFLAVLAAFLFLPTTAAFAQDYPYDDVELKKEEAPSLETEEASGTSTTVPSKNKIAPDNAKNSRRRNPPLFRLGIKGGGTFSIFQNPDPLDSTRTLRYTGFGVEGGLAFGWDLPYQPIFIEFETGYRGLLMTAGEDIPPLHVIPLSLSLHYRYRMSRNSLWKPGFRSSLDVRIAEDLNNPGSTTFGIFPSVSFSSIFEIENFLLEPLVTISRLQSQYNFVAFALRTGFRF